MINVDLFDIMRRSDGACSLMYDTIARSLSSRRPSIRCFKVLRPTGTIQGGRHGVPVYIDVTQLGKWRYNNQPEDNQGAEAARAQLDDAATVGSR